MTSAVAVRTGGGDDRAFVRDLGRRSASTSVSPLRAARDEDVLEAFDRLIDFVWTRRHDALIAETDGARAGFLLLLYDVPDEVTLAEQAFVAYMAVEPSVRDRGVGRALLDAAEANARAHGLRALSLMVTDDNAPARALYEHAGFVTERRMLTKLL
ncbi:MAG TPA: GNAT family N-acetyltransferase [Candidatus Elarobacter sp.]|nr:GNAT family N-acetyltransferase [Candidatus Elarobacter sp.]